VAVAAHPERGCWRSELPSCAWMIVIFRVSSIPGSRIAGGYSTLGHLVSYAILGGLLVLPLRRSRQLPRRSSFAVIIASAYGITDEFHQSFVPMRTPDVAIGEWTRSGLSGARSAMTWLAGEIERRRGRGRGQLSS